MVCSICVISCTNWFCCAEVFELGVGDVVVVLLLLVVVAAVVAVVLVIGLVPPVAVGAGIL